MTLHLLNELINAFTKLTMQQKQRTLQTTAKQLTIYETTAKQLTIYVHVLKAQSNNQNCTAWL